jgi:hypothetical protein
LITEPTTQQDTGTQSLRVSPATPAMLEGILKLLEGFNNKSITPRDWQLFLNYPWRDPHSPFGFVLIDRGEIVGFIATIFSPTFSNNNSERLCNISSWILKREYQGRGLGFKLINELLKSSHCTFTNMSPSPATLKGLKNLGFIALEESQTVITPLSYASSIWKTRKVTITEGNKIERESLTPEELTVFENHLPYPCNHFHIRSAKGNCYGIFRVSSVGKYRIAQVHYLSNVDAFISTAGHAALWMLRKHRALKLIIESRMLKGRTVPLSVLRTTTSAKLYRPGAIAKEDIPNCYSEPVMLP